MKMTFSHTAYLVLALTSMFLISSCFDEREIEPLTPVSPDIKTAEIPFLVNTPTATAVTTRGETGTTEENKIEEIHVLVFKTADGELVYKGRGKGLKTSGDNQNTVTFKVTVPVGDTYDFMVLANAGNVLAGINVGADPVKTKTDVEALVLQATNENSENGKWKTSAAIPMWDEQRMTLTASSIPAFNLMRMLARIHVEYTPAASAGDVFRLTEIRYYNYNTSGKVVPDMENFMEGTGGERYATFPTLPVNPDTQFDKSLAYTDIADYKACKNQIYVFEAENRGKYTDGNDDWIKNPCLVVGGKYDSDGNFEDKPVTWYRIDFVRKNTVVGEPDEWFDLLRNFSYNVAILSVNGEGYKDPDVALKSAPLNITSGVLDWNDGRMDKVIFDGMAYLSVDKHELFLPRHAVDTKLSDGSNILRIKTDYKVNGYPENSGWKAEYYTDREGTIPMTDPWLKLHNDKESQVNRGKPTGTPDDPEAETYFSFGENTGTVNREAWVYITAGRLRYRVHVVQKLLSVDLFEVVNGAEVPVDSMLFQIPYTGYDTYGKQRTFRVRWNPVDEDVRVTNESPVNWNPFDPAWVKDMTTNSFPLPAPDNEWSFSNTDNSGMREFTVTVPPMGDVNKDPFCEKTSTYRFEVGDSPESEKKGITLHYVYYNLLVNTYVYRLDGRTYSMNVRSNAEWKITKVEEWLYNQNPATNSYPTPVLLDLKPFDNLKVGTTGGPNVPGESIAFTTVNTKEDGHERKWGTVWVTFESPDGKFPPQRIPLTFSPETRAILTLGYTNDVRAFNVGKTSPYHKTSLFEMLSNISIFGESDKAVVKTPPLEMFAYNCEEGSTLPNNLSDDEWHWRKGDLKKWINLHKPTFIVMSYSMRLTRNESKLLIEYMRNGGPVIMYYGGDLQRPSTFPIYTEFFKELFGLTTMNYTHHQTAASATNRADLLESYDNPNTGLVYQLRNDVDHPILDGPFGNIKNTYFGTHYVRIGIDRDILEGRATSLCNSETNIRNTYVDYGYSMMFVHNTLPLFWVGNGMGTATYFDAAPAFNLDPILVGADGLPKAKPKYGAEVTNTKTVHNSFVFANAVAWAISKSNYQHPANNYSDFAD